MIINVDPTNPAGSPTPLEICTKGFNGVRLVSRQGTAAVYAQTCMDANLAVVAVVTAESGGFLCPADVYQIGNEPDAGLPSQGPNNLTAADYVALWNLYRDTYPTVTMIGAGLSSGKPQYWRDIQTAGGLRGAAGFAVHPYNKTSYQALALLMQYRAVTPGLGMWITEWNRPAAEVADFAAMLHQTSGVVGAAWFCWADGMVPGFGLSSGQQRMLVA